jgi:DNA-binding transcriptional ArsR family regulator
MMGSAMPPIRQGPIRQGSDRLSATFAALADPTRRAMLAQLALHDMSVGELAEPFDISLPAVSKHLKVLEHAGLVRRSRKAQYRPCRIDALAMKPAVEWLGQFALLWEARFDRLEDYLAELTAREKKRGRRK